MTKKILLSQGKVALVDDVDFYWLNKYKWCARKHRNTFYAVRNARRNGKRILIHMHREIINAPKGRQVDHRKNNGLDNRRENLRLATNSENQQNSRPRRFGTSRFKGVMCAKSKWRVKIKLEGKSIHIGFFDSEIEAARAYDKAAVNYFGEYAYLNFATKLSGANFERENHVREMQIMPRNNRD